MRSQISLVVAALFLFVALSCSVSNAVELARVGNDVITSEEFLDNLKYVMQTSEAPEGTLEGRKEFLDRIIAKHLLSGYFHSRGWDTLSAWNYVLLLYEKSIYIQALYIDAIPGADKPSAANSATLRELALKFVDSLTTAYSIRLDEDAITLVSAKSSGVLKTARTDSHGDLIFRWSEIFTDEEKKLPVATFAGGQMTIGECVAQLDRMPGFAKPMAGNSEQISGSVEQLARDKVLAHEFEKRNLRKQPWFVERMTNKREELIADEMFTAMSDTCTVTEEEARQYYEQNRDGFVTPTRIKVATITVGSEEVAKEIGKRISEGESFESLAVDFSVYTSNPLGYDTTDFIDMAKWPAVYEATWDKQIGEVVGPLHLLEADSWVIVKLLVRENTRLLSFEEAAPMIVERLQSIRADAAVAKLIDELRAKVPVKIDYETLEKLELPGQP